MKSIYHIIRDKRAWCCLSIFYSRKSWTDLLLEIASFYHNNKNLFNCCLIYLSEERGEHIRITFSLDVDNIDLVLSKIENHFLLFLKKNPSVCSKEFLFGKGFWRYYPNNSLAWNRYNMQYHNMDLPLDERLKVCLSDFQNSRLADNPLLEEKAFALLEQIQQEVAVAPNGISLAKWGCLVECLAQNFFLEGELDELLEETDDFLITLWRGGLNEANVGISQLFLWMGDYFLFRFCDKRSQCYSYSFQMLEQMLHCLLQFFSQLLHSSMYVEPVFLFPISFWQDLEWWLLRISEFSVSEFAKKALDNLYALPDSEILLRCIPPMNALRWQLRNGIFLNVSQGL